MDVKYPFVWLALESRVNSFASSTALPVWLSAQTATLSPISQVNLPADGSSSALVSDCAVVKATVTGPSLRLSVSIPVQDGAILATEKMAIAANIE